MDRLKINVFNLQTVGQNYKIYLLEIKVLLIEFKPYEVRQLFLLDYSAIYASEFYVL